MTNDITTLRDSPDSDSQEVARCTVDQALLSLPLSQIVGGMALWDRWSSIRK